MFKLFLINSLLISLQSIACDEHTKESIDSFFQNLSMIEIRISSSESNIANARTTRTKSGGAYTVQVVSGCELGECIIDKSTPPILKYDPNHPDASGNGYVAYPDVNVMSEMANLVKLQRAKEYLMADMPVKQSFFFSKEMRNYLNQFPILKSKYDFENIIKN